MSMKELFSCEMMEWCGAPTASFPSNLSTSQHKRRRRLRLNAEITKQLNFVIRYSIIHVFK